MDTWRAEMISNPKRSYNHHGIKTDMFQEIISYSQWVSERKI